MSILRNTEFLRILDNAWLVLWFFKCLQMIFSEGNSSHELYIALGGSLHSEQFFRLTQNVFHMLLWFFSKCNLHHEFFIELGVPCMVKQFFLLLSNASTVLQGFFGTGN